jgi:hypothetical protein
MNYSYIKSHSAVIARAASSAVSWLQVRWGLFYVSEFQKPYTYFNYMINIKGSRNGLKLRAANGSWKKLWPEAITDLLIP